ncbi:dihydrodipicolinate synthase family protein [Streptomyces sp. NBC_00038]|uniref:dihydrodipicolinate synthase family protein n=1 Tax=Streptomyces sp. NBC_00038 TaxID=2903615 RepID=UPI0022516933|nr:dihydrodipicolinate synthase family protein [Streptomyces sp. NBC_00038]MCX5554557.1 dihydrodipicolinate synthase family protein [Streptomyces sp. NBC_00038]
MNHGSHKLDETLAMPHAAFELGADAAVGVKEATKDFEHFSRVLHACERSLLVCSGIDLLCLPLLALGGAGFVSAVSNLAPRRWPGCTSCGRPATSTTSLT